MCPYVPMCFKKRHKYKQNKTCVNKEKITSLLSLIP
jgi:hypothetical protein